MKKLFALLFAFIPMLLMAQLSGYVAKDSLWPQSQVPATPATNDGSAIAYGTKFQCTTVDTIIGARFYKGNFADAQAYTVKLWRYDGTLLATKTVTAASQSGWIRVLFDAPYTVSAGVQHLISVHSVAGYYPQTPNLFAARVTAGNLIAIASSEGGNGVYSMGDVNTRPVNEWNATSYWVSPLTGYRTAYVPPTPSTRPPANWKTHY